MPTTVRKKKGVSLRWSILEVLCRMAQSSFGARLYLNSGQTRRASRVDAIARSRELEKVVDATGAKSTTSSRDEVGANLLRSVYFTVVVAGLAVEGANPLELGGCRTVCCNRVSDLQLAVVCL